MIDAETFLDLSRIAARQIAAVAVRLQGQVANEGKAGGGTPESDALSAVDLAAQDIYLELLHDRAPQVALDAEEDTPLAARFATTGDALVVLDPIDGTLSYLSGSDDWAIMAGLVHGDRFEAASVCFPALGVHLEAARGRGTRARRVAAGDDATRAIDIEPGTTQSVLVGSRMSPRVRDTLAAASVRAVTCRCSAVEGASPLLGRADGDVVERAVDRRHAIPLFASLEAGAAIRFGDRAWGGEDPGSATLAGPTVMARTAEEAARLVDLVRSA